MKINLFVVILLGVFLCVSQNVFGLDDDDDEDDFQHQLVIFAVGGLTGGSFSAGWMPFTYTAAQSVTNHARTVAGMA
jgi:hypothetical protein